MPVRKDNGSTLPRVDDKGDNTHVPVVQLETGVPVVTSADREVVETIYFCRTAFTGASVGDRIIKTRSLDVTLATPTTIWTQWHNDTTSLDLASAPSLANLAQKPFAGIFKTTIQPGNTYSSTAGAAALSVVPSSTNTSYTFANTVITGRQSFGLDVAGVLFGPQQVKDVVGGPVDLIEVR
jgi:hypothetical protein